METKKTGQNSPPAKSNLSENFARLFASCEAENLQLFEQELAKICPAEGGTTRIQAGGSPEKNSFSVTFFCTPNCPNPGANLAEKLENIISQSPQNESDTLNYCLESVLEKPGKFQLNFLMPVEIKPGEFAFQFSVKPLAS